MDVSVCICAVNEQQNIANAIHALQEQHLNIVKIREIIVVSSSTDKTDDIVKNLSKEDCRIILVQESERKGKASAINQFLEMAKYAICVFIGADVIPRNDAIERLCEPLSNPLIGMTGAHSIPVNNKNTFIGYNGYLEWEMLHRTSMKYPKLGECIAIRRINSIDQFTSVDEAYMEYYFNYHGYKLVYVPEAIIYNRTPETLKDLVIQRRRIYAGHLRLWGKTSYKVSTLGVNTKGKIAIGIYVEYLRGIVWMPMVVLLELYCMGLGTLDFLQKKDSHIWKMVETTKREISEKERFS